MFGVCLAGQGLVWMEEGLLQQTPSQLLPVSGLFSSAALVTQNLPCLPATARSSPSAAPLIPRPLGATLSSHFCPYPELFTWAKLTPLPLQDGGSPHPQAASSRGTCLPRLPSPHPTALGSPSIGLTTSHCGELLCLRPWTPERMAVSLWRVQLSEFTLVCPSTCLTLPASKGGTEESQARLSVDLGPRGYRTRDRLPTFSELLFLYHKMRRMTPVS